METKRIFTLIAVLLFTIVGFAQQPTDKEIGFDEEEFRKSLVAEGLSADKIEQYVVNTRKSHLARYNTSQAVARTEATTSKSSTSCGNVDFEDDFMEWCYYLGQRDQTTSSDPDPGPGGVPVTDIAFFCDDLTGSEGTDIVNATDPPLLPELDLSTFSDNIIQLGNTNVWRYVERISKTVVVSEENRLFSYQYAVAFEDPDHNPWEQPYFRVYLEDASGNRIDCSLFEATSGPNATEEGFICAEPGTGGGCDLWYRQPAKQSIDLIDQGVAVGESVTIVVEIADCTRNGHYGYAYFEGSCGGLEDAIIVNGGSGEICIDTEVTFESGQELFGLPTWNIYDGTTLIATFIEESPTYTFTDLGDYDIELIIDNPFVEPGCEIIYRRTITVSECLCGCDSFSPEPGDYVLSAWVKEDHAEQQLTYENSYLEFKYIGGGPTVDLPNQFYPSGEIIDGWQRIVAVVTIPSGITDIQLELVNESTVVAYFDDIRFHPFNSNMKSFVYDQATQRLMAELDENNYATFYEYDQEGGLIRVKKETAEGVYTIQETRSGNSTLNGQN